jgi:outer membrane lipoprotein-sorting protein
MKKINLIFFLAFYSALFSLTVDEILDKSEANDSFKTMVSVNTEEVYRADGTVRTSVMKAYAKNGNEMMLMEYIEPNRIQGMKVLMLNDGDDIWFYSNRTNRVRKIASHQKKQSANNSDFSYDDMSMSDNRKDYDYSLTGEEEKDGKGCYKIEFKAKEKDQSYSRFFMWIDKSNFLVCAAEFYDENDNLWKSLTVRDIKKVQGYWTAGEVEMKDILKESKTVIRTDEVEYDTDLPDGMFSERGLSR